MNPVEEKACSSSKMAYDSVFRAIYDEILVPWAMLEPNSQDLLQLQPWPVLRVVGGAAGGLVVREGPALTSQVTGVWRAGGRTGTGEGKDQCPR